MLTNAKLCMWATITPGMTITWGGVKLKVVEEETDVGVIIQKNLKPTKHCQKAANTATGVLRTIQRNFHYRDKKIYVKLKLYKQYVRPHLEFVSPAWAPWAEQEKNQIEAVQKKAINWIPGLVGASYEEKCLELGLSTLEDRRWEQDMVQTYKIPRTRTANVYENLKMPRFRTEVRRNTFSIGVIKSWNSLPDSVKQADTVPKFKNGLREYLKNGGRPGSGQERRE
jgi:hypothetical protein